METSAWQPAKWLVVGVRLGWEGWHQDRGNGVHRGFPQHPWLWMAMKLGQAGTGLSHWTNSKKQRSTQERSSFQILLNPSCCTEVGRPLGRTGLFELGPHSKTLSCGPGLKHLLGALPL